MCTANGKRPYRVLCFDKNINKTLKNITYQIRGDFHNILASVGGEKRPPLIVFPTHVT